MRSPQTPLDIDVFAGILGFLPESNYAIKKERRRSVETSIACGAIALAIFSIDYNTETESTFEEREQLTTEESPSSSDIDTIILHPFRIVSKEENANKISEELSDESILNTIKITNDYIRYDTQGNISVLPPDNQEFETVVLEPKTNKDGTKCYPLDQVVATARQDGEKENQNNNELNLQVALLSDDTQLCQEPEHVSTDTHVAAYASDNDVLVFNVLPTNDIMHSTFGFDTYMANGELNTSQLGTTVIHEIGHTLGLKHQRGIRCNDTDPNLHMQDVGEISLGDHGCDFARKPDGSINEYSSRSTAMGNTRKLEPIYYTGGSSVPALSALDLYYINPNKFLVEKISVDEIVCKKCSSIVSPVELSRRTQWYRDSYS